MSWSLLPLDSLVSCKNTHLVPGKGRVAFRERLFVAGDLLPAL